MYVFVAFFYTAPVNIGWGPVSERRRKIDAQAAAPREKRKRHKEKSERESKGQKTIGRARESEEEGRTGGSCHVHKCMYL